MNLSLLDMAILLIFGVLGYFFRKLDYDLAPFILALIVGPILEESFRQSLMRSAGSFSIFWESSMALTFIVISFLLFLWNIFRNIKPKKQVLS
ncbi:MAG: hypothetical protein HY882_09600 [Deltaproteobacteria bacterium]|nr:hypothetical protein [Deltaproteobacteria bacterium]